MGGARIEEQAMHFPHPSKIKTPLFNLLIFQHITKVMNGNSRSGLRVHMHKGFVIQSQHVWEELNFWGQLMVSAHTL